MIYKTPIATALLVAITSSCVHAASNSPWTPAAGSADVTFSFASQTADRFFVGNQEMMLPTDLELDSTDLTLAYGISDTLALDVQIGYASSDFLTDPGLAPQGGLSGLRDSRIGLRYNLIGSEQDLPTVTIGLAALIAGSYDTGAITAIGDGETGVEAQILVGHAFESGLALSAGFAHRSFSNDVPSNNVFDLGVGYAFTDVFSAGLFYQDVSADGNLDVGGPGFSPARFPELDEEYSLYGGSLSVALGDAWSIGLDVGRKNDGKNTAKSRFFQIGITRSF
jgi:hypothetical protein